jgi:hypothetical protein
LSNSWRRISSINGQPSWHGQTRFQAFSSPLAAGSDEKEQIDGDNYPSFSTVITGPSRTGDIERILVLGAHGPRILTIIFCPVIGEWRQRRKLPLDPLAAFRESGYESEVAKERKARRAKLGLTGWGSYAQREGFSVSFARETAAKSKNGVGDGTTSCTTSPADVGSLLLQPVAL